MQIESYNNENENEHCTRICGAGTISSTHPRLLSVCFHIAQSLTSDGPSSDIVIRCYLNSILHFITIEDLQATNMFVRFSGELINCRRQIFTNNTFTTTVSIDLDWNVCFKFARLLPRNLNDVMVWQILTQIATTSSTYFVLLPT